MIYVRDVALTLAIAASCQAALAQEQGVTPINIGNSAGRCIATMEQLIANRIDTPASEKLAAGWRELLASVSLDEASATSSIAAGRKTYADFKDDKTRLMMAKGLSASCGESALALNRGYVRSLREGG
jgi:hypothetical protein